MQHGLHFPECPCPRASSQQRWCWWWSVFARAAGDVMGLLESVSDRHVSRGPLRAAGGFSRRGSRPPPPNCPSAPTIWRACVRPACGRGASRGDSRSTTTRARATGWVSECASRVKTATGTSGFKQHSRLAVFWDEDEDEDDAVTWQTRMTFSSARTWMLFFDYVIEH